MASSTDSYQIMWMVNWANVPVNNMMRVHLGSIGFRNPTQNASVIIPVFDEFSNYVITPFPIIGVAPTAFPMNTLTTSSSFGPVASKSFSSSNGFLVYKRIIKWIGRIKIGILSPVNNIAISIAERTIGAARRLPIFLLTLWTNNRYSLSIFHNIIIQ